MKLALITHPNSFRFEEKIVQSLFENGLELLHIRKPEWEPAKIAELVRQIPVQFRERVTLHSHYFLANDLGVGGIHITNTAKGKRYEERYKHLRVSVSTHSVEEAIGLSSAYEYAFISPVFSSISKNGYNSAFADNQLAEANKYSKVPLFALGGVDIATAPNAKGMNFKGIAVLGALWNREPQNIVSHFINLKQIADDLL
ncbi:thiamine phosphate synthase [Perlabentimonas gracilis]|uniref:thiamine phosphate synthase n=1 Tax=Perlabentimonas gracilis TaxID=2715279 RepID=UPI001409ED9D|nr:thiamine phosphate synthase [Perlabentimonas gracilis]NHB67163.1 thiamine phosphate synthase [Perlabentimonas gracilis]